MKEVFISSVIGVSLMVAVRRYFLTFSAVLGTLLVLNACAPEQKKSAVSTPAGSQAYVQNLALAHFFLERNPDDLTAAAPSIARMNGYASAKRMRPTALTAVLLSYTTRDDSKTRKLIVPIGRATDLSNLRQFTRLLAAQKPEYRTIHVRIVTLSARDAVVVRKANMSDVVSKVNDLYDTVAESAQTPPRLDAARLQIALTRFFMQEGVRDAAYVSLENAKELLAGVDTSRQEDADEVQVLSQTLENLENSLHKKLPYTF